MPKPCYYVCATVSDEAQVTRGVIINFRNQNLWVEEDCHGTVPSCHKQQFSIAIWTGIDGGCLFVPYYLHTTSWDQITHLSWKTICMRLWKLSCCWYKPHPLCMMEHPSFWPYCLLVSKSNSPNSMDMKMYQLHGLHAPMTWIFIGGNTYISGTFIPSVEVWKVSMNTLWQAVRQFTVCQRLLTCIKVNVTIYWSLHSCWICSLQALPMKH
jgi:hypothetical protein